MLRTEVSNSGSTDTLNLCTSFPRFFSSTLFLDSSVVKTDAPDTESPAKLLDDLFKKTVATPCIYWLPLTEEESEVRAKERVERQKMYEANRAEREAEIEKRREEQRKEFEARRAQRQHSPPRGGTGYDRFDRRGPPLPRGGPMRRVS